ncbi:MAG: DUF1667 domain-containing protein [Oscillospiraceae bacterium]|nr:DUF1667 domain-containing protein [Oscillospiraceae bacterium]
MKEITCISCPMGCRMNADVNGGEISKLTGNACKRGETYAQSELFDPRRMLTTTVAVAGNGMPVPVKSAFPLPKAMLLPCMQVLRRTHINPPILAGDVVVTDILGTGVDIVTCGDCLCCI